MAALLYGFKIAILIATGFEQVEMISPKKALEDAGAQVSIVALESEKVRGWKSDINQWGDEFNVDVTIKNADAQDYDALVLPGGLMGPDDIRLSDRAVAFIKGFSSKPIAAICHGSWPLIEADLVKSKRITSWPSIRNDLKNAGGLWEYSEVVVDGNLVTSRMPDDLPAFNQAMITLFAQSR